MSQINALDETFNPVTLFDKPALFTCLRIDRDTVPSGLFAYDIRHTDSDDGIAGTIEKSVFVNQMGTVITSEPLDFGERGYIPLDDERGDLNFASDYNCSTIDEYQKCLQELQQAPSGDQERTQDMTMGM